MNIALWIIQALLALLFLFTYPGAPCLYYGDEVGMKGAHDPDCRRGFPWDDSRWNYDLLNYTKAVIALRNEYPALRRGSYHRLYSERQAFAMGRKHEGKALVMVVNNDEAPHTCDFSIEALTPGNATPSTVFGPDLGPQIENNRLRVEVPARTGIVIRL